MTPVKANQSKNLLIDVTFSVLRIACFALCSILRILQNHGAPPACCIRRRLSQMRVQSKFLLGTDRLCFVQQIARYVVPVKSHISTELYHAVQPSPVAVAKLLGVLMSTDSAGGYSPSFVVRLRRTARREGPYEPVGVAGKEGPQPEWREKELRVRVDGLLAGLRMDRSDVK